MSSVILPRLIKPTKTALGQVGSVVDVILLGLTILGALGILVGLGYREYQTGSSTVRTRLLSFLVISDLIMGIVGMISPMHYLIYAHGPSGRLCDASAFMLITTFWTQYFNAISMAVSTWLILLHPLSSATRLLQRYWAWLFPIIWGLAFIAGGAAWRVTGFAFRSGFCYNDPTKGPKYFGDIFALVPRGIVLIIVVAMYSNLFIFLRRPDRISSPTSSQVDEVNVRSTTSSAEAGYKWWNRKRALGADIPGEDDASPAANRRMSTHPQAAKVVTPPVRPDLTVRSPSEKGAPWENLDLHVPDVTFGAYVDSRPTVPRRSSMANMNPSDPTSSRLASRRGSAVAFCTPLAPMQSLDVPLSLLTPPTPTQPMEHNFSFPPRTPVSPSSHTTTLHAPASPLHPSHSAGYSSPSSQTPLVLPPPRTQSPHRESSEGSTLSQAHDEDDDGENTDSSSDVDSLSPPEKRRGHALSSKPGSRKQSHAMSLKEILEQTGPPTSSSQPMTPGGGGSSSYGAYGAGKTEDQNKSGSGTVTGTGSGSDGFVGQESMNAYLNRKASLLMILFPIAYVALFSVSLVRIICDFVVANPIAYLSGLSRWMIFSQGIVDFVIYGVVEIRVKRAVRRKTSAGYFAPQPGQNSHHLQTYSQQAPLETSHHSQSHV